jgi:2-polyprenyl-3-methyl-5-hydroxy-6-metoxy-1,4-benzoquinol methylase
MKSNVVIEKGAITRMAQIIKRDTMTVKEHYHYHLGKLYSWMAGDFQLKCNEFKQVLIGNNIVPFSNKVAVDLGCGHGVQSIPIAETGFKVLAVDFNQDLLNELKENAKGLDITAINDDIRRVKHFANNPALIVCCGDTLCHLDNAREIQTFITDITNTLDHRGITILSFRDYATALTGADRFIPVKSDEHKILTCVVEYEEDFIQVTDLLHERTGNLWKQKVSSYKKVRLLSSDVVKYLEESGMKIIFNQPLNRLITIIAIKEGRNRNV